MMRRFAFLFLMAVCAGLVSGYAESGANELSNRRAPGFSLPDSRFKRYDLQDFRGKWLLIDFMKTDCPHCKALSKTLEEVKRRFPGKVGVLGVVIAPPETQATVAEYMKENNVTSPILFDQGQMAASYFNATPSNPSFDTPHLFIINPAGRIVRDYGHSEATHNILEGDGLLKELETLVNAKP
jgi:peroxiredoxin